MLSSRIARTRNVRIEKSYEVSRRIQRKEDATDFQQGRQKKEHKEFKLDAELKDLMEAETIRNVEQVRDSLNDRKVELQNSDTAQSKKQKSLEHLQNIQNMCSIKLRNLHYEAKLQKQIDQAVKNENQEMVDQLLLKYTKEKSIRKSEEYTALQKRPVEGKYKSYNAAYQSVDLIEQMEGSGNFVNYTSSAY